MRKILFLMMIFSYLTVGLFAEFDIKSFSEPDKYGWDTPEKLYEARQDLFERQKLLQIYEMKNQSITANLVKSALAPGWGHFSAGDYTKGQILLGLEIIFFGTSYYYYDSAMEKYNKYKNSTYILDINQYYEDANDPFFISQVFFTLAVTVWVYTIYDSIGATETYNDNLWEEIRQQYYSKGLSVSPTGITWRF